MRSLILLLFLLTPTSCCLLSDPPLGPADFTTPTKTLLTFHEAFRLGENTEREYECFSKEFKKNIKKNLNFSRDLDYSSYFEIRNILAEENPVAVFLFSLEDLSDNIKEEKPIDDDEMDLYLDVKGEEIIISFIRETVFRLEFDGKNRPEEGFLSHIKDIIMESGNGLLIGLFLPSRTRKRLGNKIHALRKIVVEEKWKFKDFSFLHKNFSAAE